MDPNNAEQAAPEAEQAPTPEPAAEATTEADRLAEAYAFADAMPEEPDAPEEPTEAPAEPKDPEPEAGETVPDGPAVPKTIAELEAIATKRKAEREAKEAEEAKQNELQELKAQVAALQAKPAAEVKAAGIDPKAFKADPISALQAAGMNPREVLQALTQGVLNPGVPQLEQKLSPEIEALKNEVAALKEAAKTDPAADLENQRQASREGFATFVESNASRWPNLARLPAKIRASWGWDLAVQSTEIKRGEKPVPMSDEQIADLMESELAGEATPTAAQAGQNVAASSGDAGATRNGGPKSITNDLAAPTARRSPISEEERLEQARMAYIHGGKDE